MVEAKAKHRVNITRQVSGRLLPGEMLLYYKQKPIGRIHLGKSCGMEVEEGFEVDGHDIYLVSKMEEPQEDSYTRNCDLGWC